MAQGKFKGQQKLPGPQKTKRKKPDVPKSKGRGVVKPPKKGKQLEQHKFRKEIESAKRASIEAEVASKASVAEPKSLRLVNQPSTSHDETVKGKTK